VKEQQNYELAFHLNPNLEESKAQEIKQNLEKSITGRNGNVSFSREPEKVHLAYPIQHNDYGLFGYIQFTVENADPALKELNDELKLNGDILRYLIVKVLSAGQRQEAVLKQVKAKERAERRAKEKAATPEEAKEMEEKLEGILENL
jgi:ribosomal protein S6